MSRRPVLFSFTRTSTLRLPAGIVREPRPIVTTLRRERFQRAVIEQRRRPTPVARHWTRKDLPFLDRPYLWRPKPARMPKRGLLICLGGIAKLAEVELAMSDCGTVIVSFRYSGSWTPGSPAIGRGACSAGTAA